MSLFEELKRRNVFRVGVAYIVASWVLLQVADLVLEAIKAPDWVLQAMLLVVLLGFIAAMIVAWAYEITPEGIKRESEVDRSDSITNKTAARLDRITIGLLVAVVAIMVVERFVLKPQQAMVTPDQPVAQAEQKPGPGPVSAEPAVAALSDQSVAVLPFVAMSNGPDDEYFADGLTEEILNALAQLPELLITARTSSFHFKGQDIAVQEIAAQLGVKHIVEGSVRRAGDRLRVTAQLVRAEDGFHLWSETYDSTSKDTIQVQEDIAEKIAVAMDVVMDERKRDAMRRAGIRDVEAFIAFQKGRDIYAQAHGRIERMGGLREANRYFEIAMERVPDFSEAYMLHSDFFVHITNKDALGSPQPGISNEEIKGAFDNAVKDMEAAILHAPDPITRANAELDLAIFTGNWRGLTGRFEQVLSRKTCAASIWMPAVADVFGFADRFVEFLKFSRACDPLRSTAWYNEARSMLWAGDPEGATALVREGVKAVQSSWLTFSLIRSLVANGQFEAAEQAVVSMLQVELDMMANKILIAAAKGDREETNRLIKEFKSSDYYDRFFMMLASAWAGDRVTSNRMAAEADRHQAGAFNLLTQVHWCSCGAPFDLEAAPNFAARLEEAGLPWPPASPIKFPLKDW